MESSLHRALKEHYAGAGDREVPLEGFRIDAVDPQGWLVEVQSGSLGPLRHKLKRLLPAYRVRLIKPVALERRLVRRARRDGPDLSSRRSPKRGGLVDVFDDLVGLATIFPDANLRIDVLAVSIEEIRVPRRRSPYYDVVDRRLIAIEQARPLEHARDLWSLLPGDCQGRTPFTTHDLARRLDRPLAMAQRVAYCLRRSGAALALSKQGNSRVYVRGD